PFPQPFRAVWSGKSGHAYANAVELELNSRVFSRFRESILTTRSVKQIAGVAIDPQGESRVLLPYIRKVNPYDRKSLTLGDMAFLIDKCNRSQVSIMQELKGWIQRNFPLLLAQRDNLKEVNRFRQGPAHGNAPEKPAENIPFLCIQIIDSLVR